MTLATWKQQFYPVPADQCQREEAVAHSLRKWEGLRREALAAHDLKAKRFGHILVQAMEHDSPYFEVNCSSCALCVHYLDTGGACGCRDCPLSKARDGRPCDVRAPNEEWSPWQWWSEVGNPEPMIAALQKAQEWESAQALIARVGGGE